MAFPTITTASDSNASAALVSACAAAGLNVNGLNGLAQLQLAVANLLSSPIPSPVSVPASQVTAGTFGAGAYTFPAALTITGLATLSAGATIAASQTLTFGATTTVAGTPTWSSSQAITLSTAAQPNITSLGTLSSLTVTGLITANGGVTVASGQTVTLTGATVAGAPTWSASQAITLSTAAQPNITSVGVLASPHMTSPTVDSGTSSLQALTATTITGTGILKTAVSGMTNSVALGQLSDATTYGVLTLNETYTAAGMLGIAGGGSTDKTLFLKVPTAGAFQFHVNGTSVGNMSSSGIMTAVAVELSNAATATSGNLRIGGTVQSTVGAAGAASAIPTPLGYIIGFIGATKIAIPYCNG